VAALLLVIGGSSMLLARFARDRWRGRL
jgi:hypothetical protein